MDDNRALSSADIDAPVALVTGGARRIGAAICRTLHGARMRVAIHHHTSGGAARALADELESIRPGSAITVAADLLDTARLTPLVDQVTETFGRLDVLVNNASSFYPTPLGKVDEAAWDDLIGTNLKAPLFLSQAAAPWLRERRGSIINLADIHGQRPLREHPVYCAAKAGLIMLTQALARDLGPQVRVNAVAPGPILWPDTTQTSDAAKRAVLESTALERMGDPEDIARTVLFLIREGTYVTGQTLAVDGGRSISA